MLRGPTSQSLSNISMCWRAWQVFPEGDENDALSSHPSSAEENKNEEPACEANRCRCPMGLLLLGRRGLLLL